VNDLDRIARDAYKTNPWSVLSHFRSKEATPLGNGKTLLAGDNKTSYSYFANGLPQTVTDALNHTRTFVYETSGNLTSQTDAAGNLTSYTYDGNGNKLTQAVTRTLPGGPKQTLTAQYAYDGDNRLIRIERGQPESLSE